VGAGRGNVQIWGTQPDAIDEAEDRDRWMDLLERLDIKQPPGTMATTEEGALAASAKCVFIPHHLLHVLVYQQMCPPGLEQQPLALYHSKSFEIYHSPDLLPAANQLNS